MSRYMAEDQDLEVGSGENWESLWLQFQFPRSNIGIVAAGRDSAALPAWQLHLPLPLINQELLWQEPGMCWVWFSQFSAACGVTT